MRSPPQGSGSGAPVSLVVSDPSVVPLSPVLAASGPDVRERVVSDLPRIAVLRRLSAT